VDTELRAYRALAAAALSGRTDASDAAPADHDRFLRWLASEGLSALIARAAPSWAEGALRQPLFEASCRQVAIAALQERELRTVAATFERAGIAPIFLKGTALAHTVYEEPALRGRRDTDFLIPEESALRVQNLIEGLGYERVPQAPGQLAAPQFHYGRFDERGVHHALDVHLRISNVLSYGQALDYQELRADAVALPGVNGALIPSPLHSLLIACIHRVAHHHDSPRLLWLLDIHRLSASLGAADWERLLALTAQKRLSAVLLNGLIRAGEEFEQRAPGTVLDRLAAASDGEGAPPILDGETTRIDVMWADLASAGTWQIRARLVREHLFPPRAYMRQAYARFPDLLLPLAYVARIVRGAPKWFRRANDAGDV
jgi:hypothetical protein